METNTNVCVGAQNKPKNSHVSQSHCLVSQKRTILLNLTRCKCTNRHGSQMWLFIWCWRGKKKKSWRPALWSWMILGQGCIQRIYVSIFYCKPLTALTCQSPWGIRVHKLKLFPKYPKHFFSPRSLLTIPPGRKPASMDENVFHEL